MALTIALYERAGLVPCPALGPYPALPPAATELSVFLTRSL